MKKNPKPEKKDADKARKRTISKREARSAAPDTSVCGEEDPGSALEFLVNREGKRNKP